MSRRAATIPELDGLRGLAILLVLGRHGMKVFHDAVPRVAPIGAWDAATPFINGWAGVDLFFVLSGFLITHHLLNLAASGPLPLRTYFVKRILRIVPTYYAVLFLAVLGWLPGYRVISPDPAKSLAYHMVFLQDYLPADIIVAFWSLGVEEKFYLLAPFLCLAVARVQGIGRRMAWLGALAATPLALRTLTYLARPDLTSYSDWFTVLRSPFHVCLDGLVVGMACAFLYHWPGVQARMQADRRPARWAFWAGLGLIAALLGMVPLLERVTWFNATVLQTLLAAGFGGMLFGLLWGTESYSGVFRMPWLAFFAKISYSLYLVHMACIGGVFMALDGLVGLGQRPLWQQMLLYLPVYWGVSIAAGTLLHMAVERPFLRLKDRL